MERFRPVILLFWLALSGAPLPGAKGGAPDPAARAVFFTGEDLARARARAEGPPWAARAYRAILAAADRWCARPYPLPEGPTGYYHDYVCPDHGVPLRYDPDRSQDHACPVDGKTFRGPKLDAYWVSTTIRNQLQAAVQCALAWRFTGSERHRDAAYEVLLRAAHHYRDRIAAKSPRRWMWQSLDEAVYVLDAVRAFELLAGGGALSPADAGLVRGEYLLPTARFLRGERKAINNINSWYNAAILAIGVVAGDDELVRFAIGEPGAKGQGLLGQLEAGVSAEGFWREGSIDYHFYTLTSLEEQFLAARGLPLDLGRARETMKSMYLAPLDLADRAWVVPPTNDSAPVSLDRYLNHYEIAAGLFPGEEELSGFLAAAYRKTGRERGGPEALFRGPEALEADAGRERKSRDFPDSGLAVLRTSPAGPPGGEVYLLLKYGPHGGAHGHPDKLSISLHGLDRVLSPDTGTGRYSLPLTASWYRQTLSHNTVVVDRVSQKPATGKLLAFRGEGPLKRVVAGAGEAYPGVAWTRAVHLSEEGIVCVQDRLAAEGTPERTFDWVWHGYGEVEVSGAALEPLPGAGGFGKGNGYDVPRDLRGGRAEGDLEVRWKILPDTPNQPEWRKPGTAGTLRLLVSGAGGTEVYAGVGPGNPPRDPVPLVVVRKRGAGAFFRAVLEVIPEGAEAQVKKVEPAGNGLRVVTRSGAFTADFEEGGGGGSGGKTR